MFPDWYKLWYNSDTGEVLTISDREHEDYYESLAGNPDNWIALGVIDSIVDSGAYARTLTPITQELFIKIKAVLLKMGPKSKACYA